MTSYDHKKIEKKWQTRWRKSGVYRTKEQNGGKKFYVLDMFPYASGEGLHVGHPKGYIATDVYSRFMRSNGYSVLHPMGFDAFGLPAENYALANKINPAVAVAHNVKRFKEQLEKIGLDYDWSREINTTDPAYYRWTQWIFLQMFKAGLAYESNEPINWCPSCKTGLANEDVDDGRCERCGTPVEKKPMRQWVLKITDYAEKLLDGLGGLDWPESIKELQRNWIGKSEGALISFEIKNQKSKIKNIEVFTTRADTLFGATYLVLAPEHELLKNKELGITNYDEVLRYIVTSRTKTEIERTAEGKEKTGVELKGVKAINPANNEEIPIFVADYVLAGYGTGAIMAVPAHDERDWQFAKKYNLPIKQVILTGMVTGRKLSEFDGKSALFGEKFDNSLWKEHYKNNGVLLNSGKFDGMNSEEAKDKIANFVGGKSVTKYKLRDWVFSRQRYWGEPIPLVFCETCKTQAEKSKIKNQKSNISRGEQLNPGWVPVPEDKLPVKLPNVKSYEPTGTGESPLANIKNWVNVKCPKCGGEGKRETNTMPQWAGSCWYYLRYTDPKNKKAFADRKKMDYWLGTGLPLRNSAEQNAGGVDFYVGGAEHATRHLIYARFWHQFLFDKGLVAHSEPFKKLQHVGLILAEDGRKMSKRWGNIINPDDIIERFGADALRVYEMFMGPFDQSVVWNTDNLVGAKRFLERVWRTKDKIKDKTLKIKNEALEIALHQTIKKVTEDIKEFKFNTAISQLMIFTNVLEKRDEIPQIVFETFLTLLTPFAPHIAEELWELIGNKKSIQQVPWPTYKAEFLSEIESVVAVQINGKTRGTIMLSPAATQDEAIKKALAEPQLKKWIGEGNPRKVVYIAGKILSIVV